MSQDSSWERFHQLIGGEPHIKALRQVVSYLMTFLDHSQTSAKDIAKVISADPALATQVLTVVNSAALGLRQHVSDLKIAVSLLGYDEIRDIVLNIAIMEKMGKTREMHMTRLWEHSFYCAKAAGIIARSLGKWEGEAFTIGLIHDIGKILLCYSNGSAFATALNNYRYHRGAMLHWESEKQVLGLSHAEIGGMACLHMKIPEVVCRTIWSHHALPTMPVKTVEDYLSRVVYIADLLCWIFGHPSVNTVNPFRNKPPHTCIGEDVTSSLGLSKGRFQEIVTRVQSEFRTGETILEAIRARKGPVSH